MFLFSFSYSVLTTIKQIMKEDLDVLDQAIQPPNTELLNQAVVNLRNAGIHSFILFSFKS